MRRAVLAILGTAAGTTLLLGARAGFAGPLGAPAGAETGHQPGGTGGGRQAAGPPGRASDTVRPGSGSKSSGPASGSAPKPGRTARPGATTAPRTGLHAGTFTGATAQTQYGPVQVRIVVADGRMTGVTALQLPSGAGRSIQISNRAGPLLRQEALKAQNADIDTVSGATYTSEGYRQSLQAALDAAKKG